MLSHNNQNNTVIKLASSIIKNESIFGLFKGLSSPIIGLSFINSVVFGSQMAALHLIEENPMEPSLRSQFLAGLFSGFVQSFVTSPVELIKIRLQMSNIGHKMHSFGHIISSVHSSKNKISSASTAHGSVGLDYINNTDCIKKIFIQEQRFNGLMNGLFCTMLRDVPFYGIYFWSYNYFFLQFDRFNLFGTLSSTWKTHFNVLLSGGMSGILTWSLFYPLDSIKTHIQANVYGKYNLKTCINSIIKEHGVGGFYNGLKPCLIRAFPVNAVTFGGTTLVSNFLSGTTNAMSSQN